MYKDYTSVRNTPEILCLYFKRIHSAVFSVFVIQQQEKKKLRLSSFGAEIEPGRG